MKLFLSITAFSIEFSPVRRLWLVLFALLLAACGTGQAAGPASSTNSPVLPTVAPPVEQAAVWSAWKGSPHAQTYGIDKGSNTYCARCHAPENWDVSAKIDPAPGCVSCKFSQESEPRLALSNPFVDESEWRNIGCEVCHLVENGLASAEVSWLDRETQQRQLIDQADVLCEQCHTDRGDIQRGIDLGQDAHTDFSCIDCHDPHSTIASCVSSGCHADVLAARLLPSRQHANLDTNDKCLACHADVMQMHSMETQRVGSNDCLSCHPNLKNLPVDRTSPPQHSKRHTRVDCAACHDAAGMDIQQSGGGMIWATYHTLELPATKLTEQYTSHNLQKSVSCQRCHAPGNPWDLVNVAGP